MQGDARKGTKVGRKQQQQQHGLLPYKGSFGTIRQGTFPSPPGPRLWGGREDDSDSAPTAEGCPPSEKDKAVRQVHDDLSHPQK